MTWLKWGSMMMFLGIALGAFGAHALRDTLSPEMKKVYETAVFYHLLHGLALLGLCGLSEMKLNRRFARYAGILFTAGIFLFSGSLYLLALTGVKKFGMITPLGGLSFLLAWIFIFLSPSGTQKKQP